MDPEEPQSMAEKYNLPAGFSTEKGSRYSYNSDGSVHRQKFDGTEDDYDVTVFIDTSDEYDQDQLRRLGLNTTKGADVYEIITDSTGKTSLTKIRNVQDISDPESLVFLRETAPYGSRPGGLDFGDRPVRVSLTPKIGWTVFQTVRPEGGSKRFHPGHAVVTIF